jgi:hypothetical protein
VLSSGIAVDQPSDHLDVAEIQSTHLEQDSASKQQFLIRERKGGTTRIVDFQFLAPEAETRSMSVQLATSASGSGPWTFLEFLVPDASAPALFQMIQGPATLPQSVPFPMEGSSRRISKATHVPLRIDRALPDSGRALPKFGFLHQLLLQPAEVDVLLPDVNDDRMKAALRNFADAAAPSLIPAPSNLADIPVAAFQSLGNRVIRLRQERLDRVRSSGEPEARVSTAMAGADAAEALNRLNAAVVALSGFELNVTATPIGMLNLERLEFKPAGIQRGELIATIPLAPLEKTAVVHKEWSVTTKELSSIVTDQLENFSETGVTENTELAQSTAAQTEHANQFNINATVTGSSGFVTTTVAAGFAAQDHESASAQESRKHAIGVTRKASTRVKSEHKVTISTTTVTGTSESSTRMLENPSPTNPIRIDYFSMLRKWHVSLYRYGLRLTYDIAIPEPGAALRGVYAQIADLEAQLKPFDFGLSFTNVNELTWAGLATRFQAAVPPPPEATKQQSFMSQYSIPGDTTYTGPYQVMELKIDDGYEVTAATVKSQQENGGTQLAAIYDIQALDVPYNTWTDILGGKTAPVDFLVGRRDRQFFVYGTSGSNRGIVILDLSLKPTGETITAWQQRAWSALFEAAQAQYSAEQQSILGKISELQDRLRNVDTLTLRREENEEIMKGVLRWLLGPAFDFMPDDVVNIFRAQGADLDHGIAFAGNQLGVTSQGWSNMFLYQEMVKFINEAIEWENVLYFLYSYFWDVPPSWEFVRQIRHADATRQAFLRAGSARVVLTVRKGWETAWVSFVETGGFGRLLTPGHPYMSIASEIAAYDQRNYPGIPPANPGATTLPENGLSVATESSDTLLAANGPVTIRVSSSAGFLVGYTAIVDLHDSGVQETQTITAAPDATHITVERLEHPHDGSVRPFAVMQSGEKGQLMAEWFEYTPTSGTDIAVTSNMAAIA